MTVSGLDAAAFQGGEVFRAGAEDADPFVVDQVDQALRVRVERRAVVQHHRAAYREGRDQPVPHHPAARGVVEQALAGAKIAVQAVFLDVLQEYAAGAVDDAFGHAGGAAGIEDVQRMGEGHRDEIRFAAGCVEIVPQCHVGRGVEVFDVRLWASVRHDDQLLQ
ncbi:hypothetical protein D3C84_765600 [compost metagenome]